MKIYSSLLRHGFAVCTMLLVGICSTNQVVLGRVIEVGDAFPKTVALHQGFPPSVVTVADYIANQRVIVVGLPGAFTPTWSTRQVPGYLEQSKALSALGIDKVIIYCVNDGAVMAAWGESLGVTNDDPMIQLLGDPYGEVTKALEMELVHPGPYSKGLVHRCKRFALYIENGIVQIIRIAEGPDDPAGDDFPDVTLAESMIQAIQEFRDNATNNKKSVDDEL